MTPKEKAEELILKFEQYSDSADEHGFAIKCAIIAVDEILNEYKSYNQSAIIYDDALIYWQEVKQEIEKL